MSYGVDGFVFINMEMVGGEKFIFSLHQVRGTY